MLKQGSPNDNADEHQEATADKLRGVDRGDAINKGHSRRLQRHSRMCCDKRGMCVEGEVPGRCLQAPQAQHPRPNGQYKAEPGGRTVLTFLSPGASAERGDRDAASQ